MDLVETMSVAVTAAFDTFRREVDGEQLYAFALQTDDDAMSVGPCANTEEGFAASRSAAGPLSADDEAYLRWAPAEWRYEAIGDDAFATINQRLCAIVLDGPEDGIERHVAQVVEAMTAALAALRASRAAALAGVTLFVTVSDSDDAEAVENASAARLNPPDLARDFAARFDRAG